MKLAWLASCWEFLPVRGVDQASPKSRAAPSSRTRSAPAPPAIATRRGETRGVVRGGRGGCGGFGGFGAFAGFAGCAATGGGGGTAGAGRLGKELGSDRDA